MNELINLNSYLIVNHKTAKDIFNTNVWVFVGERNSLPSGVFSSKDSAESWISDHYLTGVLTSYPVDIGIYEWAIEKGYFNPTKEHHKSPDFIQNFSSANLEHYHYENGRNER